jgi:hypothetical protein
MGAVGALLGDAQQGNATGDLVGLDLLAIWAL